MPKLGPTTVKCPFCDKNFTAAGIKDLKNLEIVSLHHATCEQCGHGVLLRMIHMQNGIASLGIATDLIGSDAEKVVNLPAVREFELLAFHEFLRAYNFSELFFEKITK